MGKFIDIEKGASWDDLLNDVAKIEASEGKRIYLTVGPAPGIPGKIRVSYFTDGSYPGSMIPFEEM